MRVPRRVGEKCSLLIFSFIVTILRMFVRGKNSISREPYFHAWARFSTPHPGRANEEYFWCLFTPSLFPNLPQRRRSNWSDWWIQKEAPSKLSLTSSDFHLALLAFRGVRLGNKPKYVCSSFWGVGGLSLFSVLRTRWVRLNSSGVNIKSPSWLRIKVHLPCA